MTVRSDFKKMEEFRARATAATAKGLTAVAIRAQGRMRDKMTLNTGGAPSKPGEAPNVQKGTLWNAVVHQQATASNLLARAGTNKNYGKWLEFGYIMRVPKLSKPNKKTGVQLPIRAFTGPDGKKVIWVQKEPKQIAARPWVRPVLSEFSTGKRAVRIFQNAFKASLGVK